jgi:tetratricopeptide (TPR) repeat protein
MWSRPTLRSALVAGALFCLAPLPSGAQADTSLKLTTTAQVNADFRAGVRDYENLSFESAADHFAAVSKADPNFGLGRVMFAATSATLTPAQQRAEMDRGVADAARASTKELILAAAYREQALGNNTVAAPLFRAASELMPSDRLVALSGVGFFPGQASQVSALKEYIGRNPDYSPSYNTLAYLLWPTGDRAGALAAAKRQVELNPNAPNPHDSYAEMLQWSGNYADAANEYRRATQLTPKFPEAYAGLAEVAALQGRYDDARSFLNQAITNAWTPQQKLGYERQIAGTYTLQTSPALAKQLETIAVDAKAAGDLQTAATAYSQLATVQAAAGNTAASHASIALAKSTSADYPWNVNYFAAMSHALMKHWGPANQELAALKARSEKDPTVSKVLVAAAEGNLLTQQGKPADALKVLMATDTTNILVINRIAEAHAALGHAADAASWNGKINEDRALNLASFTEMNSRRRAKMQVAKK